MLGSWKRLRKHKCPLTDPPTHPHFYSILHAHVGNQRLPSAFHTKNKHALLQMLFVKTNWSWNMNFCFVQHQVLTPFRKLSITILWQTDVSSAHLRIAWFTVERQVMTLDNERDAVLANFIMSKDWVRRSFPLNLQVFVFRKLELHMHKCGNMPVTCSILHHFCHQRKHSWHPRWCLLF